MKDRMSSWLSGLWPQALHWPPSSTVLHTWERWAGSQVRLPEMVSKRTGWWFKHIFFIPILWHLGLAATEGTAPHRVVFLKIVNDSTVSTFFIFKPTNPEPTTYSLFLRTHTQGHYYATLINGGQVPDTYGQLPHFKTFQKLSKVTNPKPAYPASLIPSPGNRSKCSPMFPLPPDQSWCYPGRSPFGDLWYSKGVPPLWYPFGVVHPLL